MTPDQINRMMQLRPDFIRVIECHGRIDGELEQAPLSAMLDQVRFTAASLKAANGMMEIINELLDEAGL